MTYKLSILIPARNEVCYDVDLLYETVVNVLQQTSAACELVVVCDGYVPPTPLPVDPRLTVIHHSKPIGQRAATNEAARIATGEWVCKLDAHCALSDDFDTRLLDGAQDDWTIVPSQYNLLAFIWKCKKCGWTKDQSGPTEGQANKSPKPDKCIKCGSRYVKQVKQWFPRDGRDGSDVGRKGGRRNTGLRSWRFDTNLEYSQWGEYANRPEVVAQGKFHDVMSLLGACWAVKRDRYFALNMSDERWGSWGQQGFEVSAKSWTSGGRVVCNTDTWFAHFFRVGGLTFPYAGGGMKERAMSRCRELFIANKWEGQVRPLSWIIEHFAPVPDWHVDGNRVWQQVKAAGDEFNKLQPAPAPVKKTSKCALYYSCLSHDEILELAARNNLKQSTNGHEIGCVTLNERVDFGDWQIIVQREKSGTTMHYQILEGLKRSTADYVFLCESDVFYHPSHFDFTPPDPTVFYYNTNVWRVRYQDGHAVRTDDLQQVSGICASRLLLLEHYRKRIELIERNGGLFDVKQMAYEPGTRGNFDNSKVANWQSPYPNVDVTGHGRTLTKPKFSIDEFRNARYAKGWQETDDQLSGWPKLAGRMAEWLEELASDKPQHIK
jgi:hypothetical protein